MTPCCRRARGCSSSCRASAASRARRATAASPRATAWGENIVGAKTAPVRLSDMTKLVYSPHTYGPGVFPNQNYFPTCQGGGCTCRAAATAATSATRGRRTCPRSGTSTLGSSPTSPAAPSSSASSAAFYTFHDKEWNDAFVGYLIERGFGAFFFCLNPDSDDTGGLLKPGWFDVNEGKLKLLSRLTATSVEALLTRRAAGAGHAAADHLAAAAGAAAARAQPGAPRAAEDHAAAAAAKAAAAAAKTAAEAAPREEAQGRRRRRSGRRGGGRRRRRRRRGRARERRAGGAGEEHTHFVLLATIIVCYAPCSHCSLRRRLHLRFALPRPRPPVRSERAAQPSARRGA